jgi:hypothetical protein
VATGAYVDAHARAGPCARMPGDAVGRWTAAAGTSSKPARRSDAVRFLPSAYARSPHRLYCFPGSAPEHVPTSWPHIRAPVSHSRSPRQIRRHAVRMANNPVDSAPMCAPRCWMDEPGRPILPMCAHIGLPPVRWVIQMRGYRSKFSWPSASIGTTNWCDRPGAVRSSRATVIRAVTQASNGSGWSGARLSSVDFFARSQWNAVGSRGRDHRLSKVLPASGRGADAQKRVPTTTCLHLRAGPGPSAAPASPRAGRAG